MPELTSNRPFLSSILGAFRAHLALQKAAASASASASSTAAPSSSSTQTAYSTSTSPSSCSTTPSAIPTPNTSRPRTIVANKYGPTTAAVMHQARQHQHQQSQSSSSPTSTSTPTSAAAAAATATATAGFPSSTTAAGFASHRQQRRGSDSSSDGFRDATGAEKWYIGGRTARGEERFYKLQMVRRHRNTSADRVSLDRLSL